MSETILATEATIRLAAFLGVLAAMALWEMAAPRRRREIPRVIRWTNKVALVVVDTVILRLTFPILAVGHQGMEIGIEQFRTRRDLWLDRMLIQPLRGPASGHALDPRITTKEPEK